MCTYLHRCQPVRMHTCIHAITRATKAHIHIHTCARTHVHTHTGASQHTPPPTFNTAASHVPNKKTAAAQQQGGKPKMECTKTETGNDATAVVQATLKLEQLGSSTHENQKGGSHCQQQLMHQQQQVHDSPHQHTLLPQQQQQQQVHDSPHQHTLLPQHQQHQQYQQQQQQQRRQQEQQQECHWMDRWRDGVRLRDIPLQGVCDFTRSLAIYRSTYADAQDMPLQSVCDSTCTLAI